MATYKSILLYGNSLSNYGIVSKNWQQNKQEFDLVEKITNEVQKVDLYVSNIIKLKTALEKVLPDLSDKVDFSKKIIKRAADLMFFYPNALLQILLKN